MPKILITISLFCLTALCLQGQTTADVLILYGEVNEYKQKKSNLSGVAVRIQQDKEDYDELLVSEDGVYEVFLDLGYRYRFWFEKEGYFAKNFIIDTSELTDDQMTGGFTFQVDMTMIPLFEELDSTLADEPISVATYDESLDMIMFDADMVIAYNSKMEEALKAVKVKKKR